MSTATMATISRGRAPTPFESARSHRSCPRRSGSYARPDAPATASRHSMERPLDPAQLGDHLDRLYRAAWALSGSREDAEDLVQETYAARARPPAPTPERGRPRLPPARAPQHLPERETERAPPAASRPAARPARPRRRPAVRANRRPRSRPASSMPPSPRFPDEFRDVLVAVDITGLSYKEAARALRIREGTVMSRLYRARQQSCARSKAAGVIRRRRPPASRCLSGPRSRFRRTPSRRDEP